MTASRPARWRLVMRDLLGLLASWWRIDRVRLSPGEGRLLRLSPGDVLCVDGVSALVIRRVVVRRGRTPEVLYRCRAKAEEATLTVSRRPEPGEDPSPWSFRWDLGDRERELHEDEIDTYPARRRPGS